MINLNDLLEHEVRDLYSAEVQIIEALPLMVEKAGNAELKRGLQDHLSVTREQKARLDKVLKLLTGSAPKTEGGFLSGLFGTNKEGGTHCVGTEGIINEGKKMMNEDMAPEVMDAAIIACAQKIEHYEICGYGTARAYAEELGLSELERLLRTTLNEEYAADDLLTRLAVRKLNPRAEKSEELNRPRTTSPASKKTGTKAPAKKSATVKTSRSAATKTSSAKSSAKKSASKSSSKTGNKAASKKAGARAVGGRKR